MPSQIISVLEERADEVYKEVQKLVNKAKKHGFDDVSVAMKEVRFEERWRTFGRRERKVSVAIVDLEVSWEEFGHGDYQFVARNEIGLEGNILWTVPGTTADLTAFRTCKGYCDHCNHNRQRKDTFILQHRTTGELIQVGRTCLKDFNGCDPAKILSRFNFFKLVGSAGEERGPYQLCTMTELLGYARVSIRQLGWISKATYKAMVEKLGEFEEPRFSATSNDVMYAFLSTKRRDETHYRTTELLNGATDQDWEYAEEVIRWALNDWTDAGDYAHNVRAILRRGAIQDFKHIALAVSIVPVYQREVEKIEARKKAVVTSTHVGEVDKRLTNLQVNVPMVRSLGVDNYNNERYMVKFKDETGNELVWFASRRPTFDAGSSLVISGLVKKHSEFNGVKQTVVSNVRVV